jgi:uncharacterized protein YifN (PemK superfamily)
MNNNENLTKYLSYVVAMSSVIHHDALSQVDAHQILGNSNATHTFSDFTNADFRLDSQHALPIEAFQSHCIYLL